LLSVVFIKLQIRHLTKLVLERLSYQTTYVSIVKHRIQQILRTL